jgi:hypothetical protein
MDYFTYTALRTSMFPRQRENTAVMDETFSTRSVPKCYNQDQLAVANRQRTAVAQSL